MFTDQQKRIIRFALLSMHRDIAKSKKVDLEEVSREIINILMKVEK